MPSPNEQSPLYNYLMKLPPGPLRDDVIRSYLSDRVGRDLSHGQARTIVREVEARTPVGPIPGIPGGIPQGLSERDVDAIARHLYVYGTAEPLLLPPPPSPTGAFDRARQRAAEELKDAIPSRGDVADLLDAFVEAGGDTWAAAYAASRGSPYAKYVEPAVAIGRIIVNAPELVDGLDELLTGQGTGASDAQDSNYAGVPRPVPAPTPSRDPLGPVAPWYLPGFPPPSGPRERQSTIFDIQGPSYMPEPPPAPSIFDVQGPSYVPDPPPAPSIFDVQGPSYVSDPPPVPSIFDLQGPSYVPGGPELGVAAEAGAPWFGSDFPYDSNGGAPDPYVAWEGWDVGLASDLFII